MAEGPRDDPNWPRASAWLAGDHDPNPAGVLAVLGAPLHVGSITPGRCDLAPPAIRAALRGFSTWAGRTDVGAIAVTDLGDLDLAETHPEQALKPLAAAVRDGLEQANALVILGGDNSLTRPGVHGLGPDLGRLGLLTLDAHFDLRDLDGGLSNGNPVRALLTDGLPGANVVQIGIQPFANSPAYADAARDAGIAVVTAAEVRSAGIEETMNRALDHLDRVADAIYVDLDLDVLDRTFAPGSAGSRPGGLMPWEVMTAARMAGAHPKVRVIDLVEVDPTRDIADSTVLAAAASLLHVASGLADR